MFNARASYGIEDYNVNATKLEESRVELGIG